MIAEKKAASPMGDSDRAIRARLAACYRQRFRISIELLLG
jgi:hypothetical protein